jgi:hypothetical protein
VKCIAKLIVWMALEMSRSLDMVYSFFSRIIEFQRKISCCPSRPWNLVWTLRIWFYLSSNDVQVALLTALPDEYWVSWSPPLALSSPGSGGSLELQPFVQHHPQFSAPLLEALEDTFNPSDNPAGQDTYQLMPPVFLFSAC